MKYNIYKLYTNTNDDDVNQQQSNSPVYVFHKRADKPIQDGVCDEIDLCLVNEIKQSGKRMLCQNKCSILLLETTNTFKDAVKKANDYRVFYKNRCVNARYNKRKTKEKNNNYYKKHTPNILANQRQKQECSVCGRNIRKYYMKRHMGTKRCMNTYLKYDVSHILRECGDNIFDTLPKHVSFDPKTIELVVNTRFHKINSAQFNNLCRILERRALELLP